MRTESRTNPLNPATIFMVLLAAAISVAGIYGAGAPLLTNLRFDISLVIVLGMAVCAQGGIGRVAASGQWRHPLSIIGYLLGGAIALVTVSTFAGWKLPLIADQSQALLAVAILIGIKVLDSAIHNLVSPGM